MGRFHLRTGSANGQVTLMDRFHQWGGSINGQVPPSGRLHLWTGSMNGQVPPMDRFRQWAGYTYGQVPPVEKSTNGQVLPVGASKTSNRLFERLGFLFLFGKWQFQTVKETDGRPWSRTAIEERGSGVTNVWQFRQTRTDRQQYEYIRHETAGKDRQLAVHVTSVETNPD